MREPAAARAQARAGEGLPWLVLIPGTLCDGRVFARQVRALRGRARVLHLDYRTLTERDGSAWLRHLLRTTLPPRFSVAGFSLGGLLALELLRLAPERIERLAMIASNAEPASRKGYRKGRANWRLQRDRRLGARAVIARAQPLYFHSRRQGRRHAAAVLDMALRTPDAAARAQFHWAGTRPGGHDVLGRFPGPVLIASGAKDPLCPPAWQRAMQRTRPDAVWHEYPRCGHFVSLEAAAPLGHALRRWLAQPAAPSSLSSYHSSRTQP